MFWNTIPICPARSLRSSASVFSMTFSPWMRISPALGSSRRLMWRTRVDLPLPDSPITQKISPSATLKFASATPTTQSNFSSTSDLLRLPARTALSASSARSPKIFQTFLSSITSSLIRRSVLQCRDGAWT